MNIIPARLFLSALLAMVTCLTGPAMAAVIDFEGAALVSGANAPYTEDGFQLALSGASGSNHYDINTCSPSYDNCGTRHIVFDNPNGLFDSSVRLTRVGGGQFDLLGFDVFEAVTSVLDPVPMNEPCAARCQLKSSAGGLVDISTGRMDFLTGEWRNLDWIEFLVPSAANPAETTTVRVDNIAVSPVPLPSALILLGTALAGMLGLRRGAQVTAG